jgi:hypothetical protein
VILVLWEKGGKKGVGCNDVVTDVVVFHYLHIGEIRAGGFFLPPIL